ncbi:type VII secretion system-associated protein [Streptomyces sp. NPDC048279]|uniref:type VII secretion system-associated protein n=1 Tax=Streptomyces sp. NPDC048279 TaxID=3154714 RepID=UPI00342AF8AB
MQTAGSAQEKADSGPGSVRSAGGAGARALPDGLVVEGGGRGGDARVREQVTPPDEIPEVPEAIVNAARLAPDHYFYMPDPQWAGEGTPPQWAVVGRWRSDSEGGIVDWEYNDDYQPSPEALGWREPADEVDAAVQLAVTGYGPSEAVPRALVGAVLHVFVDQEGDPVLREGPEGSTVVPVFTMTAALQETELPPHRSVSVVELIAGIEEGRQLMYLSPTSPVQMVLPYKALRAAAE